MRVFMVLSEISVNNGGIVVRGETVLFLVAQNPGMVGIPAPALEQPARIGLGDERAAFVGQYMSEYHEESVMSSTTRSASGEATVPFPLLPSNHLV